MGFYNYKLVVYRDDYAQAKKEIEARDKEEYENSVDYDGDAWCVTEYLLDEKDKRIAELEAEAKGGDIMAAKDAERIAELEAQVEKQTMESAFQIAECKILRRKLAELKAENERLRGNIPAYEPPPCECCRKFTDYYAAECDCGNLGDHEAAVRWCTRMEIADSFDAAMDNITEEAK